MCVGRGWGLRVKASIYMYTVSLKEYAYGLHFVVRCCDLVQGDLPISFRVTSQALGQYDCPSTSGVTLKDMGKYIK